MAAAIDCHGQPSSEDADPMHRLLVMGSFNEEDESTGGHCRESTVIGFGLPWLLLDIVMMKWVAAVGFGDGSCWICILGMSLFSKVVSMANDDAAIAATGGTPVMEKMLPDLEMTLPTTPAYYSAHRSPWLP
ncbi:hypothetical protein ACLOJK_015219 [Asimina triloba]